MITEVSLSTIKTLSVSCHPQLSPLSSGGSGGVQVMDMVRGRTETRLLHKTDQNLHQFAVNVSLPHHALPLSCLPSGATEPRGFPSGLVRAARGVLSRARLHMGR